ncbi:MAG: diguanylate cyclase, partial [Actinobacteria bacterium]|nr:diguanylate cyclase [Actinomycetota bacterium]
LAAGAGLAAFGPTAAAAAVPAAVLVGLLAAALSRPEEARADIAAELAETQRRLDELALRDPLTGVLNHRAFQDSLETELRRARRESWSVAILAVDVDGFRELNDRAGHAHGDALLVTLAQGLSENLRPGDLCGRVGGDEFMLALSRCDAQGAREAIERLREGIEARALAADVGRVSFSAGVAEFPRHAVGRAELMRFADGALYWAKSAGRGQVAVYSSNDGSPMSAEEDTARLRRSGLFNTVHALARAVDARDGYTHMHSQRVAFYAATLASAMGLSDERVEQIRMAGLLHDVGKIGIRDAILLKPGRLTRDEVAVMRRHSELGRAIVAGAGMTEIATWVGNLHERIDGRGYPDGLSGDEIPIESRILHVADALEAMTCPRLYSDPLDDVAALEELERNAGSQFDAAAVRAMCDLIRRGAIEVGEQPRLGVAS